MAGSRTAWWRQPTNVAELTDVTTAAVADMEAEPAPEPRRLAGRQWAPIGVGRIAIVDWARSDQRTMRFLFQLRTFFYLKKKLRTFLLLCIQDHRAALT